jgi:hypothetical protein
MIKLKTILGEGYAWEREAGKPLPTLEQTTAAYAAKMQEEEAKPDYIDADGDGDEEESMKKAFADKEDSAGWKREAENLMNIEHGSYDNSTLNDVIIDMTDAINYGIEDEDDLRAFIKKYDNTNESVNELSDDEIDARWNKPQQNWQRQFNSSQMDVKSNDMSKSLNGGVSKFYQEKLAALEAERQQIEFDMEQEAEPEGGPIADYYGGALENIDNQISAVRSKMNKNESTFTTKAGLQEMREIPLEQRILRNLKGNDYILSETFKK